MKENNKEREGMNEGELEREQWGGERNDGGKVEGEK